MLSQKKVLKRWEKLRIKKVFPENEKTVFDKIASEAPLEIFLRPHREDSRSWQVLMRTPGQDFALSTGLLFAEGIIEKASDFSEITYCTQKQEQHYQKLSVRLRPQAKIDRIQGWSTTTSSSCGLCGRSTSEQLFQHLPDPHPNFHSLSWETIHTIYESDKPQELFGQTGGTHSCSLFSLDGKLLATYEDIGRHNALDKLVGDQLLQKKLPLNQTILFLSGRIASELVYKAARAQVRAILAVGAPTTLAIEIAQKQKITLVGFTKARSANIYTNPL